MGSDVYLYTSVCNYVTLRDSNPRGSEHVGGTEEKWVIS